jgi:prolyl oligopeptidase
VPVRTRTLISAIAALAAGAASAQDSRLIYPQTARSDVVEVQFGEKIADPYRWLENDVRSDPAVADWVKRQNSVTDGYLATLPQRGWFAARIRDLMDFERFGLPEKAGANYFYLRNLGLQNQSQLFVRKGLGGKPRLLIDPNAWANDGATALAGWKPSNNGRLLAYLMQESGSDWRTIRLLDVGSGKVLKDEIKWAKFTGLAWIGHEGFLYSRFPEPEKGQEFQSPNTNQAVYFHKVGTPQSADQLVYATPDRPELSHSAQVTFDGRWVVITTAKGTDNKYELHVVPLAGQTGGIIGGPDGVITRIGTPRDGSRKPHSGRIWQAFPLINGLEHDWRLIDGMGDTLYFITNKGAPKLKVAKVNLATEGQTAQFSEVIPEREETLERAQIVGNRLILNYLKDAASTAEVVSLDGKSVRAITLNAFGTASGFSGKPGDSETFYTFASFNQPGAVYRFDSDTGQSTVFAKPKLTFDPVAYLIERRFFTSKDGTKVPMLIVRKKSIASGGRAVPTLLYGYGGFEISLTPTFSATRMAWLEAGGAFALANLRGGGEYGKAWHEAGRLSNKQNVFDDFIAAGEYLIAQGITPKGGLAIQGGSNGGLLVGAVVNQRPDLFAAAIPQVGVMDMLRFDKFTSGRYWTDDYGKPSVEADWRVLRAYSPYHNIRSGIAYPAVLVTTADTDDRVVPAHSFKYAAALQAASPNGKPHLIRIETRAGHGTGKPTGKVVAEGADVLSFLAQWTGLAVPAR